MPALDLKSMNKRLSAGLVALFVALITLFLALAGVLSTTAAQIVLFISFLIGALFIWIEMLQKKSAWIKATAILALLVALGLLDWWALSLRRSHLYISRTQFILDDPPMGNFADVMFRNEGEFNIRFRQLWSIAIDQRSPDDEAKQHAVEDKLFARMLDEKLTNAPELELSAHGETLMTSHMPFSSTVINSMPPSAALYFMGRIIYTDENGTHHTDFCTFVHNKPEPVFYCKGHNEAP